MGLKKTSNRIAFITQYFPPEMGAPQSRLYEAATGLQKLGWEVLIITAMPNYPSGKIFPGYKGSIFKNEMKNGLSIWRTWLYTSNSRKNLPRIISLLSFCGMSLLSVNKLIRFNPDFIITESPPLPLGISGLLLARFSHSKHILNVSDIWPLSAYELGAISNHSRLYRWLEGLERYLYRKSYACMGQSSQIVEHLERNGAKQWWLFRNGVNIERFNPPVNKRFTRPFKIVYAGLLGVAQGILPLCQNLTFQEGEVEFHIYGDGPERLEIDQYLQNHPHRGIMLHNPVSRDEIPSTLCQYDLSLIPLAKPIFGAVPSKIYESMAAGLPIIFAGGGEGARIVQDYNLGWVCEPSDFNAIQRTIDHIRMDDIVDLEEKRQNCLDAAKNIFSRGSQIEQLHKKLIRI